MLKAIGDTIIIKPHEAPEKTDGGIFLSDRKRDVEWKIRRIGTVVSVGSGKRLKDGGRANIQLKTGDVVHFQPMAEAIEIDGQMLVFAKEDWILAKIEGK